MKNRSVMLMLAALLLLAAGCAHPRTDQQVADDVKAKINADNRIPTAHITVDAQNGVVTLNGTVGDDSQREFAAADAGQVQGVKTVINNLTVPAPVARRAGPPKEPELKSRPVAKGVPPANAAAAAPIVIPAGTAIRIRTIDAIDTSQSHAGDTFTATLESPIVVGDQVVIPKGADIEGKITNLKSAGHFTGKSELALELSKLTYAGHTYAIQTNQYTAEGASRGVRTAETVGGGAVVGALIGGLAGKGKGAAIGAAVGAGAGTAVQAATKGQQLKIPSESLLDFSLQAPIKISAGKAPANP